MQRRKFPENPNLENLKKQAKSLLKGARADDYDSLERIASTMEIPKRLACRMRSL